MSRHEVFAGLASLDESSYKKRPWHSNLAQKIYRLAVECLSSGAELRQPEGESICIPGPFCTGPERKTYRGLGGVPFVKQVECVE